MPQKLVFDNVIAQGIKQALSGSPFVRPSPRGKVQITIPKMAKMPILGGGMNPCGEIPLGDFQMCNLPGPQLPRRKPKYRSLDDEWES